MWYIVKKYVSCMIYDIGTFDIVLKFGTDILLRFYIS